MDIGCGTILAWASFFKTGLKLAPDASDLRRVRIDPRRAKPASCFWGALTVMCEDRHVDSMPYQGRLVLPPARRCEIMAVSTKMTDHFMWLRLPALFGKEFQIDAVKDLAGTAGVSMPGAGRLRRFQDHSFIRPRLTQLRG
jgi:hypothetical protein